MRIAVKRTTDFMPHSILFKKLSRSCRKYELSIQMFFFCIKALVVFRKRVDQNSTLSAEVCRFKLRKKIMHYQILTPNGQTQICKKCNSRNILV